MLSSCSAVALDGASKLCRVMPRSRALADSLSWETLFQGDVSDVWKLPWAALKEAGDVYFVRPAKWAFGLCGS